MYITNPPSANVSFSLREVNAFRQMEDALMRNAKTDKVCFLQGGKGRFLLQVLAFQDDEYQVRQEE